jgi:membrane protein DedA with SNARE-associated domain
MVDSITDFIGTQGYWAIALLMLLENIFPPMPSELIMPFAGFVAARGDLHPVGVVTAGTVGSVLGALPWFFAARHWGGERLKQLADRHGRWLTVSREELDRAERWFARHGSLVLVFGRLLPGVRTLIAVPAGFTGIPLARFVAWSALGSLLWCTLLTGAGYLMQSRYEQIAGVLDLMAKLVLASIAVAYAARVMRAGRRG